MTSRVEIRVRGPVRIDVADRLHLSVSLAPTSTVLRGTVADRPALHGVLERLRADGLELIEVRRLPRAGA